MDLDSIQKLLKLHRILRLLIHIKEIIVLHRSDKAKTRRSRDGTKVKKGNKWFFGYKLHQIMDLTYQLIKII